MNIHTSAEKQKHFLSIAFALVSIFCTCQSTAQDNRSVTILNNTVIFDLFLNYELTEKNGNSSVIIDYVPNNEKGSFSKVRMESNYGGETEQTTFYYNDSNQLQQINYQKEDNYYVYELSYSGDKLTSISVAGKKKINFNYRNDTLIMISREKQNALFEYNLSYKTQGRVDIKLSALIDGKKRNSSESYYLTYNETYDPTAFKLDFYTCLDITYSDLGTRTSFAYYGNDKKQTSSWDYEYDEKSNWKGRSSGKYNASRTFAYR